VNELNCLTYEQLADYVEQREQLINQIQAMSQADVPVLSQENKDRLANVLLQDKVLLAKMHQFKAEAKLGLIKMGTARIQKEAYDVGFTPDSVFFDKRK
jgi:hypothetical protein